MVFRIKRDAKKWFKDVTGSGPLSLDFDIWYLCLMAGLASGRKVDVPVAETSELVDYFPGKFESRGRVIVAAFIGRELAQRGIKMTERKALHTAIAGLVSPRSPSHLSDEGMHEINRYAHGGFDYLVENFDDRPRTLDTFLPIYKQLIDGAVATMPAPATEPGVTEGA